MLRSSKRQSRKERSNAFARRCSVSSSRPRMALRFSIFSEYRAMTPPWSAHFTWLQKSSIKTSKRWLCCCPRLASPTRFAPSSPACASMATRRPRMSLLLSLPWSILGSISIASCSVCKTPQNGPNFNEQWPHARTPGGRRSASFAMPSASISRISPVAGPILTPSLSRRVRRLIPVARRSCGWRPE